MEYNDQNELKPCGVCDQHYASFHSAMKCCLREVAAGRSEAKEDMRCNACCRFIPRGFAIIKGGCVSHVIDESFNKTTAVAVDQDITVPVSLPMTMTKREHRVYETKLLRMEIL